MGNVKFATRTKEFWLWQLLNFTLETLRVFSQTVRAILVWSWKMVSVSLHHVFHKPVNEKIKTWTLPFLAKENPNIEKGLFEWPILLQYDIKVKYPLISRKFLGMSFFHPSVHLTPTKSHTRLCPFDKPVRSLYFCSLFVSVLFRHFHFKVIQKLL